MLEIRLLLPGDAREDFVSGDEALDRYFRLYAGQNQFRHRIGVNYVAIMEGRVIGYAGVSPAHIEVERLPARLSKRLPGYPLPVLRLARLATDHRVHGQGVGLELLR
jgi:predicted N-acetyltransferase YhbS